MAEYDKFMSIYGGKWQYDRDENLQAFMDYTATPQEERDFMKDLKPIIGYKRSGDAIEQNYELMPGTTMKTIFKFGEEYFTSDTEEPKKWDDKSLPTMEGDTFKQVMTSMLPAPRNKTYIAYGTVVNGELIFDVKKSEDGSHLAKTWYKKID